MSATTIEQVNPASNTGEQERREFVLFFAGAGGRRKLLGPLGTRLRERAGEGNFDIVPSALFAGPISKEGSYKYSQLLVDKLQEGYHVVLGAHSFGGTQRVETLMGAEAIKPGTLDRIDDIELDSISTTEQLKNGWERMKYLARYPKLVVSDMARVPLLRGGFYRAIVGLLTIPPSSDAIDQITLKNGLREAFYKKTTFDGTLPEREYSLDSDYLKHIEPTKRTKVSIIDNKIGKLMEAPKENSRKIKRVIKKRARMLFKEIEQVYALDFVEKDDVKLEDPHVKHSFYSFKEKIKLFGRTFITGKTRRQYLEIIGRGIKDNFEITDFDRLHPLSQIPDDAGIIQGTHTAPFAAQRNMLR